MASRKKGQLILFGAISMVKAATPQASSTSVADNKLRRDMVSLHCESGESKFRVSTGLDLVCVVPSADQDHSIVFQTVGGVLSRHPISKLV